MITGVSNTGSGRMVRVFVDSLLELVEELVDLQQVVLGPQIRQG